MSQLKTDIAAFFAEHAPEDMDLVLDSTGPSLTKHYLALDAIGAERLARIRRIHTFSGGTFAYFGYLAAAQDQCRHPMSEYYAHLDLEMRRAHRDVLPIVTPAMRYLRSKTLFESAEPMERVIRYVFRDELLDSSTAGVAPNFTAYFAPAGQEPGLTSLSGGETHAALSTVFDVIRAAVNIPFLYGRANGPSDPAFHPSYRKTLREICSSGTPTLVITPWRTGKRGSALFVNPFAPKNQKLVMGRDIACLLTGIPNKTYGRDLKAIFG